MGEIKIGPGVLYIGSEPIGITGELSVSTDEIDIIDDTESPIIKIPKEVTIEGECKINQKGLLSILYGSKLSNNWLKMLGGVMIRNRAYKKIKRS